MIKVLFVCVHNSARSQMAEAFLNQLGKGVFFAESAGLEPGKLDPFSVQVMKEIGYDISQNKVKSVFHFYQQGKIYSFVIKVCDQMKGQKCPIFPLTHQSLNWNIEDPTDFEGSYDLKLEKTRKIRDEIKLKVLEFIAKYKD
ncbi:arsenate reductase ArsC [bacterium]|nr:arsenate reductase ArsC [bacterium]